MVVAFLYGVGTASAAFTRPSIPTPAAFYQRRRGWRSLVAKLIDGILIEYLLKMLA